MLDFMARLAALVPKPRVHLTWYHGVFAPHSRWRAQITPAERRRAMTWAHRLKRVFQLDLSSCENCGGQVRVIASIEDPAVIGKILAHREQATPVRAGEARRPAVRGPPDPGAGRHRPLPGGWRDGLYSAYPPDPYVMK